MSSILPFGKTLSENNTSIRVSFNHSPEKVVRNFSYKNDDDFEHFIVKDKNEVVNDLKGFVETRRKGAGYFIPVSIMLDLSASMNDYKEECLSIVESVFEEFKNNRGCVPWVVISVIHRYKGEKEKYKFIYSGRVENFSYEDFEKQLSCFECSGSSPLVEALVESEKVMESINEVLDNRKIPHSCPIYIFISDYKASDDISSSKNILSKFIEASTRYENISIMFNPTNLEYNELGFRDTDTIDFGSFVFDIEKDVISNVINRLRVSSTSVADFSKEDADDYNKYISREIHNALAQEWRV